MTVKLTSHAPGNGDVTVTAGSGPEASSRATSDPSGACKSIIVMPLFVYRSGRRGVESRPLMWYPILAADSFSDTAGGMPLCSTADTLNSYRVAIWSTPDGPISGEIRRLCVWTYESVTPL